MGMFFNSHPDNFGQIHASNLNADSKSLTSNRIIKDAVIYRPIAI